MSDRDQYGDPTEPSDVSARPRVIGARVTEGRHAYKTAIFGTPLEPVEDELMVALVNGKTVTEFSDERGYSASAVNGWTNKIRDRLGARTMFEAVHLWTMDRPVYRRLRRRAQGEVNRGECDE